MHYFKKSIEDMAEASLRCVAFAYRLYTLEEVPGAENRENWNLPENELILLGIVGIKVHDEKCISYLMVIDIKFVHNHFCSFACVTIDVDHFLLRFLLAIYASSDGKIMLSKSIFCYLRK